MHIHILGICGTFMGGVAALAVAGGHRVTGCDANVYPPMSTQLGALGIDLVEGFGADQLALAPDLWVIGNVVTRGNPLMEALLNAGAPYVSGPEWVGRHVLKDRSVFAVAGTHGKTTTSSMLAWILADCGLEPGYLIGGVPHNFGRSAALGAGKPFVIEADEYDTAFFDKRSKFVHYRARTVVLNNLEYDHADIFPDLAAIETQFHHLVRTIPSQGCLIVNGQSPALARVIERGAWTPIVHFAVESGWNGHEIAEGIEISEAGVPRGLLQWSLEGRHNLDNALAAIAAATQAGISAAAAIAALGRFAHVSRRMELRGEVDGVSVYDDFAHHPTAIKTTLEGARARLGRSATPGRLLAVLEPRSNTMKLGAMKALLPDSLASADLVFGFAGANLGWDLGVALAPLGSRARVFSDLDFLAQSVAENARSGDRIVAMSNGSFGGVHQKILDAISARTRRQDND